MTSEGYTTALCKCEGYICNAYRSSICGDDSGWLDSSLLSMAAGVETASPVRRERESHPIHTACRSCSSEYRSCMGECGATLADGCRLCRCDDDAGRVDAGELGELGIRNDPALGEGSDVDGGRECWKDHLRGNTSPSVLVVSVRMLGRSLPTLVLSGDPGSGVARCVCACELERVSGGVGFPGRSTKSY